MCMRQFLFLTSFVVTAFCSSLFLCCVLEFIWFCSHFRPFLYHRNKEHDNRKKHNISKHRKIAGIFVWIEHEKEPQNYTDQWKHEVVVDVKMPMEDGAYENPYKLGNIFL